MDIYACLGNFFAEKKGCLKSNQTGVKFVELLVGWKMKKMRTDESDKNGGDYYGKDIATDPGTLKLISGR